MLRAPTWITSTTSASALGMLGRRQLGHDRQPGLGLGLADDLEPGVAQARERERRRARPSTRLRASSTQPPSFTARATANVCSRVSTVQGPADQRERLGPDRAPVDRERGVFARPELTAGQLVRARDRDDPVRRPA